MSHGFPKKSRLLKSVDFDRVFSRKCSAANGMIIIYVDHHAGDHTRLGLVVSRKCGNAVVRNRWKRLLREAFRLVQDELPSNLDLVVLPRRNAIPELSRLKNAFRKLSQRANEQLMAKQRVSSGSRLDDETR